MVISTTTLANCDDPLVVSTAHSIAAGQTKVADKVEKIFYFVRDEIEFFFPEDGDFVSASETIRTKRGQCNTKGTLFLALCKALGVPVKLHFSLISREIQKGFFSGLSYWLLPRKVSHSWIEVEVDGKWLRFDSYINDDPLHKAALKELDRLGWQTGFSISRAEHGNTNEFRLDQEQFEQMGAVTDDHGTWEEPAEYYASESYRNRPGPLRMFIYRLVVSNANRKVRKLREKGRL
ncbi:MAG: transglutaminase-like domain-containing protein [Bythopirellula sp.]